MAYVIAVCGAGGKTALCNKLAKQNADMLKKVAILTTTHMWHINKTYDINELSEVVEGKIYCFGKIEGDKIIAVSNYDYNKICEKFDIVIVEADGSHMMPLKIPRQFCKFKNKHCDYDNIVEPIIPQNVNEIDVVMGCESIGREFNVVCQHSNDIIDTLKFNNLTNVSSLVTEDLIDELIEKCYIEPLNKRFGGVKINIYKTHFAESGNYKKIKKLAIVLCAAGFSKRFGSDNKLLAKINIDEKYVNLMEEFVKSKNFNKETNETTTGNIITLPLYKIMIEKLLSAKDDLLKMFKAKLLYSDLVVDVGVVSQYDEILLDNDYTDKVSFIRNNIADTGLSSTLRTAGELYKSYDAIMFINSDLPLIPIKDISLFLYNSVCSNCGLSSFYVNEPRNPAYFENKYFDEILNVSGDKGLNEILKKHIKETYKYYISEKYMIDIDTKDDLKFINQGMNKF